MGLENDRCTHAYLYSRVLPVKAKVAVVPVLLVGCLHSSEDPLVNPCIFRGLENASVCGSASACAYVRMDVCMFAKVSHVGVLVFGAHRMTNGGKYKHQCTNTNTERPIQTHGSYIAAPCEQRVQT